MRGERAIVKRRAAQSDGLAVFLRQRRCAGVEWVFPMRRYGLFVTLFLMTLLVSACTPLSKVETFRSPTASVFFTVETYDGGPGPLGSDIVKVYAHFERHGKTERASVIEGDSLTVSNIIWNTPQDATICLNSGITDSFHNQVTLILGDSQEDSVTIHNHLDEHCPRGENKMGKR